MKFKCLICEKEITNMSVSKQYLVKDNFSFTAGGVYTKRGREYFDCEVKAVFYECKCGKQVIKDPSIIDFLRDSDSIHPEDFHQTTYGELVIER